MITQIGRENKFSADTFVPAYLTAEKAEAGRISFFKNL
jgi:hypothetical protein